MATGNQEHYLDWQHLWHSIHGAWIRETFQDRLWQGKRARYSDVKLTEDDLVEDPD